MEKVQTEVMASCPAAGLAAYFLKMKTSARTPLKAVPIHALWVSPSSRCSNHFFIEMSKKLDELGANDPYFTVHVEADEHHSILGLDHLEPITDAHYQEVVIRKALEGISLWAFMLNSWIGVNRMPQFDLNGELIAE
ncbi:hypothetical protein OS242_15285 [Tumebacillus sp. DT12]|uniref:Uncharacterized protein n=1 Tax=Tumebacillus lacus TaxID=2995335 RepID=A0ABT3X6T6_9BACL|nr:hypothetical protein [Tumebacillus lacus]MCX7571315.1 hypothetical protein [Tumebacillus lacus]